MARIRIGKANLNNIAEGISGEVKDKSIFISYITSKWLLTSSGILLGKIWSFILTLAYAITLFVAFYNVNIINHKKIEFDGSNLSSDSRIYNIQLEEGGWFSFFDISQGYYEIIIPNDKYLKIDSIIINSNSIVEIPYQSLDYDDITEKSFVFVGKDKIQEIRRKDLSFYLKFPEKQNLQSIRIFVLTALLTLLLQEFLKKAKRLMSDFIVYHENYKDEIQNKNDIKFPS